MVDFGEDGKTRVVVPDEFKIDRIKWYISQLVDNPYWRMKSE